MRIERVFRAYNAVTSSSLEIHLEKMLAYLALRTGYHPPVLLHLLCFKAKMEDKCRKEFLIK